MEESIAPCYFSASDVKSVLTWTMTNAAVEQAFRAISKKLPQEHNNTSYVHQPQRSMTISGKKHETKSSAILFTMPSFVGNYEFAMSTNDDHTTIPQQRRNTLACKLVTAFPGNENRNPAIPNILANILLFNTETGQMKCIIDGTQITAWRTASASIVATKFLFFDSETMLDPPIHLAIIGCGVQGRSHAFGMCTTFNVIEIYLWNRTAKKSAELANDLQQAGMNVKVFVANSPAEAVRNADVICIATNSAEAIITAEMLPPRKVHINAVGAGQVHYGEVAADIYAKSHVYVDNWTSAQMELKGLSGPIIAEVGEVINGTHCKEASQADITIFQSTGMASEDAIVAQAVYEAILEKKMVA